jgi:hypothetical protein
MFDLRKEREVFDHDKNKPQILNAENYVENMHLAVGFASRCWERNGKGTFNTDQALRIVNELCAYVRLLSKYPDNLEFLEWKYGKLEKKNETTR